MFFTYLKFEQWQEVYECFLIDFDFFSIELDSTDRSAYFQEFV